MTKLEERKKWNDIFLEDCAVYDKEIAKEYTILQEQITKLQKENEELKEVHESDKRSLRLIAKKGADLEKKISVLLSCKNCPENKGGLLCQKEYEDKCLSQKIQYIKELKEEIAELEKELEQTKKVQVVEHFEAYGQCRDSRRIASLEKENAELKDKLNNLSKVAEVRLANWQKYEQENAELKRDKSELCNAINEKLSKAKGFIEKLLIVSCNSEILIQYPNCKEVLEARVALEQFLMEK